MVMEKPKSVAAYFKKLPPEQDLTVESGLAFADAGERDLKGVPDRWRVYRATGG
jgi:hypothetical protein